MSKAKEIAERMESVRVTKNITRAMKVVSSTRSSQLKKKIEAVGSYHQQLEKTLFRALEGKESIYLAHPFFQECKEESTVLLLLLAGERGLCGAFNQYVFHRFEQLYPALRKKHKKVAVLPIGKMAGDYLHKKGYKIHNSNFVAYNFLKDQDKLFNYCSTLFLKKKIDSVLLLHHTDPLMVSKERVVSSPIFPVAPLFKVPRKITSSPLVIYETSQEEIIEKLLPKFVRSLWLKKLLVAKLAEERTRMVAMGKATDNADELFKELKIAYNRTRQQQITRQIIEIVAGAEALQ